MSRRGRPQLRTDAEIEAALRESGGNITCAALALGVRSTARIRAMANRLGLPRVPVGRPPSVDPTPREQEALRLIAESGSQYRAAQLMGLSHQRVSQLVNRARARIAAKGAQS